MRWILFIGHFVLEDYSESRRKMSSKQDSVVAVAKELSVVLWGQGFLSFNSIRIPRKKTDGLGLVL